MVQIFFFVFLMLGQALAAPWNITTEPFAIKALGPRDVRGDRQSHHLDGCPVNPNWTSSSSWGCPASDAGAEIAAVNAANGNSWLNAEGFPYVSCYTVRETETINGETLDVIFIRARFNTGLGAGGWAGWPSAWPASVKCTKTVGGAAHTYTIPIVDAPAETRVVLPVNTTVVNLSTGVTATLPAAFDDSGGFYFNLPNGNYTGASAQGVPVYAKTTATGSVAYTGVQCGVISLADDYLAVRVHQDAANGNAYCQVVKDGTPIGIKIVVSTP